MKIRSKAIAGTALAITCCMALSACSSNVHKVGGLGSGELELTGYELTFEDNFDGDSFNTEYWRYPYAEEGVRKGGYWVNDAVSVHDGNLYITTDYREDGQFGPGWYSGCIETSVETYGGDETGAAEGHKGFSQTHGYFEVRCKVPEIVGSWAAFWMMPDSNFKNDTFGTGEDGAEIDIFESADAYLTNKRLHNSITHAIHIDGYGEELKSLGSDYYYIKDLYEDYHTYGLLWTPDEYVFYVDGHETWRTQDKVGTVAQVSHYMMLSMEVGGGTDDNGNPIPGKDKDGNIWWCGDVTTNDQTKKYDFVVDYVRVYQKQA